MNTNCIDNTTKSSEKCERTEADPLPNGSSHLSHHRHPLAVSINIPTINILNINTPSTNIRNISTL